MGGSGGPAAPAPRNYNAELTGILGGLDATTAAGVRQQIANNPSLTTSNVENFTRALRGNFDAQSFDSQNAGFLQSYRDQQAAGELQGWTPEMYAAAYTGKQAGDPSLNSYYTGGIGSLMRTGYEQANPGLTGYNADFRSTMDRLNAQPAPRYDASGYNASGYQATGSGNQTVQPTALASFTPQMAEQQRAQAYTAQQQRASGGPLLGSLEQDAARGLGQVSPLQMQQQRIAQSLLGAGGGLTQSEMMGAQDSARSAYADRGLLRSNRGIGAEILNTDAAQRNRLTQNLGLAQGIDAAGQQQLATGRNYAMGVQNQGQSLGMFNAGQGNQIGQFNAGQRTATSQFNAGQGNALGQFNAGQYNSVGMNLANGNADRMNQNNQFYANLGQQNNQFNANQINEAGRYNSNATNEAGRFNSSATNDAGRFNSTMDLQNRNDQWGRAQGYGAYLGGQSIDPSAITSRLVGQTPDYLGSLLNYGSDVNNTNFNAAASRYNSAQNNNAGLMSSGIGALGSVAAAKVMFMCIPAGQTIDTLRGPVPIEAIEPGDEVIGYDGAPVPVLQTHAYREDEAAPRFLRFTLDDGATLALCDRHRIEGEISARYRRGDLIGGRRIVSVARFAGVARSFDLLTADKGYQINGVPVDSMIEELAATAAKLSSPALRPPVATLN